MKIDVNPDELFAMCNGGKHHSVVVQAYVRKPLLLDERKIELRSYLLLIATDPLTAFFYQNGTVRVNTAKFIYGDWNNTLIHVGNTYQQKLADPNYEQHADERKWSWQMLERDLQQRHRVGSTQPWIEDVLCPRLRDMWRSIIQASQSKLVPGAGRFELFGMDTILDDDLRLWMTELQLGPGLSQDSKIKRQLIPELVLDMVDLLLLNDSDLHVVGGWEQLDW